MHEMSIAIALVEQLEALASEHGIDRIESATVRAGILRQIVPEALDAAFAVAAQGTRADGAQLTVEVAPAVALCRCCARRFRPQLDCFLCPACGQADVELLEGNHIVLASVTCQEPLGAPTHED